MDNGLQTWTINSKQCLQHSKLLTTQKPKAHVQVRTRGCMTITFIWKRLRILLDATKTRNRGEAATTLENYGRAAGAIPTAASRAEGAKNKMISYNRYLRRRTQSNLQT